ncbi:MULTISPECIES: DUF3150 domain-containing protein [Methylomonas]|uniref:DUF3150 domain-containing protein n=2 Tax=Methylomonas TaxID=416 RepID=A0A140E7J5_9GAMM|nr:MULTISPECIES: DUF3150 domain-containing protein [Methylomonas]AMK79369.1 hypothetical protein JT25_023260 [Methylomonas denitrificans]OAI03208.1 hypothetical protein A1342_08800 [Methylomonas methanica]TCV86109.1 uncharacterized protein DUF3150 [Methylomonas methanica]
MSHETQVILDRVVLIKVDANIYGARKKLKKEDLVLADGSKLPPEDLASLGSKRLLDPDKLTVFNRLKKEAERICLRVGTRFLGGFAVPVESAAGITAELERIALDFAAAKTEFIAGYDAAVNDWVVRHPEFAGIIEQAVDSVEFVSTRLSFDFLVVSVSLPDSLQPADVARLDSKIGSLSEQMFYEISVEANQLIEQSLLGKEQVTRNALRPIRRMRDKLDGLGFLDHRVAPVVSTIDDLLARIPNKGAIEGSILQEILATAMLLSDPDKTRRHGEGLLVNQTPVVEETDVDEIAEHAELEPPMVPTAATIATEPTPVIAENVSDSPDFTDLFDGIFDDEFEPESASEDWALEVLLDKNQTKLVTESNADESNPSEHSAEPAMVTAGDDEEADDSDQDYWF